MKTKTSFLQILLPFIILSLSGFAQNNEPTVVFSKETVDGITYGYRIPSLITTKKGTVLAFAERRVGLHDHAQNDMVLKRSLDNGKSWRKLQIIADFGKKSLNDPLAVELESGRILLMFKMYPYGVHTRNSGWIQMADNGYDGPRNTKSFLTYSDDDGKTWAKPREVTKMVRPHDRINAGSPGIGIQLKKGEHKGRIVMPLYYTRKINDTDRDCTNATAFSDDEGLTWTISNDIPHKGHTGFGNEAQVVERADGSLLYICRNHGGLHRKIAESNDGGFTWNNMRLDFGLPGTACQGSVLRYSWPEEGESIIAQSSPANKYGRNHGTVRLSVDEGKTWKYSREITPDFFAYSCLTKLKTNTIGLLYESNGYQDIVFTSFTVDWVKNNSPKKLAPYLSIPIVDINEDTEKQVVVDKEEGQYLGHPTTILLEDGKTILTTYPKGHGRGPISLSNDAR